MEIDETKFGAWEDRHLSGDSSDDAWMVDLLRSGLKFNGRLALYEAASQKETFQFLQRMGVNLTQVNDDGASILFDYLRMFDLETYKWLAGEFAKLGVIDKPTLDGITALSSNIKSGELDRARILLEEGASVNSVARIRDYGGAELDIPTQAVLAMPMEGNEEDVAIEALKLLREYGMKLSAAQKEHVTSRISDRKVALKTWVIQNL